MLNRTIALSARLVAVAAMGGLWGLQAVAQQEPAPPRADRGGVPSSQYDEAYRTGYRAGYDAARNTQPYDDRPEVHAGGGRDLLQRWRQRYAQNYTFNDDNYYRTCRSAPDPAGVFDGAVIGGLIGDAASRGNGGPTAAGVIVGGALGAAMTKDLDCEDQSYAYKTYYEGFNSGRPNTAYQWRNPGNGHHGNFRVVSYATDPDGFHCANFSQQVYISGHDETSTGLACQQPDGTWTIVG